MNLTDEAWRPVVGFEQYYEVSNLGNIRSKDRVVKYCDGRTRIHPGQIVLPYISNQGYVTIRFKFNGVVYRFSVHRCVAKAWIPNPKNLECVDHIDNVKTNNKTINLQWITREANITKKIVDGTAVINRGNAKLNWSSVRKIREMAAAGVPRKELCKLFGIQKAQVSQIIRNKSWAEEA